MEDVWKYGGIREKVSIYRETHIRPEYVYARAGRAGNDPVPGARYFDGVRKKL